MRCCHACCAAVRRAFIESAVLCVAHFSQLSSGRQVGCGIDMSTNLPLAWGSHATNPALSAKSGRITTEARSGRPRGVGFVRPDATQHGISDREAGGLRELCGCYRGDEGCKDGCGGKKTSHGAAPG